MMKYKQSGDSKQKKPYTKPEVKQVQLKPEEAVLGGCKVSGSFGLGFSNCTAGGEPGKCKALMS